MPGPGGFGRGGGFRGGGGFGRGFGRGFGWGPRFGGPLFGPGPGPLGKLRAKLWSCHVMSLCTGVDLCVPAVCIMRACTIARLGSRVCLKQQAVRDFYSLLLGSPFATRPPVDYPFSCESHSLSIYLDTAVRCAAATAFSDFVGPVSAILKSPDWLFCRVLL